jgi:hypothetical protein
MKDIQPVISVVVHPVDVEKHPDWGVGYRWTVQVGGMPVEDLGYCANAGKCDKEQEALMMGDRCAATVVTAFSMFNI